MSRFAVAGLLIVLACGMVHAKDHNTAVGLSIGVFRPTSSATRGEFGSSTTRWGLTTFEQKKPDHWRFTWELGDYSFSGNTGRDARLIPLAIGVQKGLNQSKELQPYVAVKGGPYYGHVSSPTTSSTDIGLNLNASVGVVIHRDFYAEIRYDYFSEIQNTNFNGFSLSAGVKLATL